MFRPAFTALLAAVAIGAASPPLAQQATQGSTQAEPDIVDIVFSEIERRIIRDYYDRLYRDWSDGKRKGKNKEMPPGLARKDSLPPGLAKQLVEKGTLPPGIAKRSLPSDLALRLPPRPDWQEIIIVDDKVLLIQRATNLILDILLVATADAHG